MFNFLSSCGLCSNQPKSGDFAYEVFKKVPSIGGIFGNTGTSLGSFSNIIGGVTNLIGNRAKPSPTNDATIFNNNLPNNSVIAGNYTFQDLVDNSDNNQVIKKILKSNYNDLNTEYREKGQKYTDPDFPPEQSSIGNVEDLKGTVVWKRITEIFKAPVFVSDKIAPEDILQGSIGDCYFLSAIASLAENDFRIKNLFPNLEINPSGIYMARILHRGVLQQVVVDDYFPVNAQGKPLFAQPAGGNEVWVMILEKCWAKIHKNYGNIVGGLPNEVLHAFSGAPTFYNDVPTDKEQQNDLWLKMWQAYSKGGILCCGTKGEDSVEKYGFVKGHAYTILNLYQQPHKMLKIRNPWGEKQWTGRASDSDKQFWNKISPNDRQTLGYGNKNDGIFFILWEDFVNYFDMVDICKIDDNASYSNVETEFDRKNAQIFEFDTAGGNLMLTLSQQSLRGASQKVESKGYARSIIIVGQYTEASSGYEYKYIHSSSSRLFANHTIELTGLTKGKYVAYTKFDWINRNPDTACVSLYTESPTNLVHTKQSTHKNFLYKVFLDHARNNSKKITIGETDKQWLCNDLLLAECGYGYLALHLDENSNRKLGVEIDENQYIKNRFALKKPYRGRGIIKTSVESGKQLIVLFRIKSQNFPTSVKLPTPKIYNLV